MLTGVKTAGREQADEKTLRMGVWVTPDQFRELNRRAKLGLFDGLARSEYVVGCLFGEPHDELLDRVWQAAEKERARFRAERAEREEREREGSRT